MLLVWLLFQNNTDLKLLSISKIREVAGTDKQGTNAYGMIKAVEQLGFTAKGVKGNQDAFLVNFRSRASLMWS